MRLALIGVLAMVGCKSDDLALGDTGATSTTSSTTSTTTTTTGTGAACDFDRSGNTVGALLCTPDAQPGYTLFAPSTSRTTYLIDLEGQVVHTWTSTFNPGESVYLEENGHLLRTAKDNAGTPFVAGGSGGRIQELDWDSNVVWEFRYSSDQVLLHHDVARLPSGNVLMIAWEAKTQDEAVAEGRDPDEVGSDGMWADHLIEVDPSTDEIVWQWHVWDHLVQDFDPTQANFGVVADNPGLVDVNLKQTGPGAASPDWNHMNGVNYNAALDQIVVSVHDQDEVWIIDHNTTTEEARGPAGNLIFRWGNPSNYGVNASAQLSGQHDPEWIAEGLPGAGNLLVFNNGVTDAKSSIIELVLPLQPDGSYGMVAGAYGPVAPEWTYSDATGGFFSSFISGSQRLNNGNTLICEGANGRFFEVTADGDKVWEYVNPVVAQGPLSQGEIPTQNRVFRADRYPEDYPAFDGVDLTPQGVIEL